MPSIETFENIKKGKYEVSRLNERYRNAALPNYEIINLNNVKLEKQSWLSAKVIEKVNLHLKKKDQVLFFLNRRGFSPNALCNKCFSSFTCPNCTINLVYHKNNDDRQLCFYFCGMLNTSNNYYRLVYIHNFYKSNMEHNLFYLKKIKLVLFYQETF